MPNILNTAVLSCLFACAALTHPLPASAAAAEAPNAVGCQGRVLPQSRVRRVAAPADQGTPIIEKLLVEEGAEVKAGDVLAVLAAETPARLMAEQAAAKLTVAKEELAAARAAEAAAKEEIALQKNEARAAVATAESALAALNSQSANRVVAAAAVREIEIALAAQIAAQGRLKTDRPVFVAKLDAAVATAQVQAKESSWGAGRIAEAALAEARAAREAALRDYDAREAAADSEVEGVKGKLATARARLEQAQGEPSTAAIAAAESQLVVAKERLGALSAFETATVAHRQKQSEVALAATHEAEAALRIAKTRHEFTRIKSPVRGGVLRVFARPGETPGLGGIVAEVADLSQMVVEAEVAVSDSLRVRVGMVAEVRLPGAEKVYGGKVARVGWRVVAGALADENPTAFKDLRVVLVEIVLDAESSAALAALTGAQVQVNISAAK